MQTTLAIDFGTTNSLACFARNGEVQPPIPLDAKAADPTVMRSVIFAGDDGVARVGADALDRYRETGGEGRLIRSIKRHLPSPSLTKTRLGNASVSVAQLLSLFLRRMRERACEHIGEDVNRTVLGHPARFSEHDEEHALALARLEEAAKLAGFTDIAFCSEPVAAAWNFTSKLSSAANVLIADLGGGTSDFTVARFEPARGTTQADRERALEVLAVGGIPQAGDAYDATIMRDQVAKHFGAEVTYRVAGGSNVITMPPSLMSKLSSPAFASLLRANDTRALLERIRQGALGDNDEAALDRLETLAEEGLGFVVFEAIERCKRAFGESEEAELRVDSEVLPITDTLTRQRFIKGSQNVTARIATELDEVLERSNLRAADIDHVCLTGGTSRVDALRQELEQRFGAAKLQKAAVFHSVVGGLGHVASMQR